MGWIPASCTHDGPFSSLLFQLAELYNLRQQKFHYSFQVRDLCVKASDAKLTLLTRVRFRRHFSKLC